MTHSTKTNIGLLVRAKLKDSNQSVTWFAARMGCSRTNAYKIFERHSINTDDLFRISKILRYNFFSIYSEELIQTMAVADDRA